MFILVCFISFAEISLYNCYFWDPLHKMLSKSHRHLVIVAVHSILRLLYAACFICNISCKPTKIPTII